MTRLNKLIFFGICACMVLSTLAYGTVHPPMIALFYTAVIAMVLLWTADSWVTGAVRYSRSVLQIPLLALAGYGLLQIIPFGSLAAVAGVSGIPRTISMEPFSTGMTALHIFALALFFSISLVYLESAARVRKMVTVILVFGFAYSFFAILQSVLSPHSIYGIYTSQYGAPFGSFVNRDNFAAFVEMALSVPLGMLFAGSVAKDKRLLYITAICLMGVSILLSGSRGGLISLVAEIILLVLLTTRTKTGKDLFLKIALGVVLVGAIVGGTFFVGGDSSLTRITSSSTEDASASRTHIWGVTLHIISSNLPLGAGLGAYAQAYTPVDTANGLQRVEQAHNDYLQMLSDAGIIGLIIGVAFLFWFFRLGALNSRTRNGFRRGVAVGAFAGCFAILVHSLFDFVLHTTAVSILFLILLAVLVAAGRKFADDTDEFDEHRSKRRSPASVTPISDHGTGKGD